MGKQNLNPIGKLMLSEILSEIVDELKFSFSAKLHKAFLFGSYARGEASAESDMDIFVLLDFPNILSEDCLNILAKIGHKIIDKYRIVTTIIPENKDEFYDNIDVIPLFKNIKREGVIFYET